MKPDTNVVIMPHFCLDILGNNGFISFSNMLYTVMLYDFISLLYWETKGLILFQYVFNYVKYFFESMLGAYSLFMYVQVW